VIHEANQTSSNEEADIVAEIVRDLLQPGVSWIDMKGKVRPMAIDDVLIVSPYNARVFNLADRLPKARIGTVDKFQGQEAPVVIYSMATSSPEDAPRGMEFLYSANRFNVATSRARCACILVANPQVFEPDCQTPRRMRLANVLCRYREIARIIPAMGTAT
jgi:superfamily I DNA and/or RNA helicase